MNKIINGVASEYDMPKKYENKSATIFIDTQDMEERYGEQLYQEYLENENKKLKEKVEQLEEEIKKLKKMHNHLHKYASDMEGKYVMAKGVTDWLKIWLEEMLNKPNDIFSVVRVKNVLDKIKELEGGSSE